MSQINDKVNIFLFQIFQNSVYKFLKFGQNISFHLFFFLFLFFFLPPPVAVKVDSVSMLSPSYACFESFESIIYSIEWVSETKKFLFRSLWVRLWISPTNWPPKPYASRGPWAAGEFAFAAWCAIVAAFSLANFALWSFIFYTSISLSLPVIDSQLYLIAPFGGS